MKSGTGHSQVSALRLVISARFLVNLDHLDDIGFCQGAGSIPGVYGWRVFFWVLVPFLDGIKGKPKGTLSSFWGSISYILRDPYLDSSKTVSFGLPRYGCESIYKVRNRVRNPHAIQTSVPDLRSRPCLGT